MGQKKKKKKIVGQRQSILRGKFIVHIHQKIRKTKNKQIGIQLKKLDKE